MFGNNESVQQVECQEQGQSDFAQSRQQAMKSIENQLTIMLLLVTILFLILMIPTNIRFVYFTIVPRNTTAELAGALLFYHITRELYFTNSGINFFLYCISGQKFRNDLRDLLCCSGEPSTREK